MGWVESAAEATFKLLPNPRVVQFKNAKGAFEISDARRRPVKFDEQQFVANAGLQGVTTTWLMRRKSTQQEPETNNTVTEKDGTVWSILNVAWELEGVIYRCVSIRQGS